MNSELLDAILRYGPIVCGLATMLVLLIVNFKKSTKIDLGDILVVGLSGSSIPTGLLLIYGAFEQSVITKLSDSGIYIAFAGIALLIIFAQTLKEKITS